MSGWWKGAWGNKSKSGGKGNGKPTKAKKPGKGDKSETDKNEVKFPEYDAMPHGGSSASSSSSVVASQEQLKKIMRAIVESNSVQIPEEAKHLLEVDEGEQFRNEMRSKQSALNKKRKAHAKVQRLREALQLKHDQFASFKQKLKEQLIAQQERYEEDTIALEKSLREAEESLQSMIDEDQEESKDTPMEEKTEISLETLLDTKDQDKTAKVEALESQLQHARSETQIAKQMFNAQAAQMQSYMQKLEGMQAALLHFQQDPKGPMSPSAAMIHGGTAEGTSPQMTRVPDLTKKDPLAPFGRSVEPKKHTGPYDRSGASQVQPVVEVAESPPPQHGKGVQGMGMD